MERLIFRRLEIVSLEFVANCENNHVVTQKVQIVAFE